MEETRRFEPELGSARAARNFVNGVLARFDGSLDEETLANVALLTSELASNAMMHSRSDFDVTVKLADGHVRVEVKDPNPRVPQPCMVPVDSTSGRGLHLVDLLASSWGVERLVGGKAVWFEMT
ncbi:MAG TPA: ATP-binding protein [Acidimicrobiales bacterium]|nr:ATP-binding protein [Acidimicrobiales bacterium]